MSKIKVGIFGASGYAGQELVALLRRHDEVVICFATSNRDAGEPVAGTPLSYIPHDSAPLEEVDAVFLALPHKASAAFAAQALAAGCRVLDLSADLRMKDAASYERWYRTPHPHPELLPTPYGLPELSREGLADARAIAVPGCYPACTLLGLFPLLLSASLDTNEAIFVDAKSGVSGAGREPRANTHFCEVIENLSPYNPGRAHRHVGEMEQGITQFLNGADPPPFYFVPHLIPVDRGLMASIYLKLRDSLEAQDAQSLYEETYQHEPLVHVLPVGKQATIRQVARSNLCLISLTPLPPNRLHITSVIDNLGKGAAGLAVQNFNLMFSLPETDALLT
ncbi:MAG: N-acetyl-gamma-glutamyl-phosphate reductase [Anaerolineaceae bacterium]|nr:N-acetyl-gamma-glutamyl-phosphate reductase [Anaerolineaceae bacterium]